MSLETTATTTTEEATNMITAADIRPVTFAPMPGTPVLVRFAGTTEILSAVMRERGQYGQLIADVAKTGVIAVSPNELYELI